MQLSEFIKPNKLNLDYSKSQLGSRVKQWNRKDFPDNALFILGISNLKGEVNNLQALRNELYSYFIDNKSKDIVDFGNIISLNETDQKELATLVINKTQEQNSLLIILTEAQQELSFLYTHEISEDLLIVAEGSISGARNEPLELLHKKKINSLIFMGIQAYYLDPEIRKTDPHPLICRLGQIRDGIHEVEPYFRMIKSVEFDINSVRFSDFPQYKNHNPNGFYAEEFCQLAWFAGNSETLDLIAVNGFPENLNESKTGVKLAAQAIWHIISGVDARQRFMPASNPEYFKEIHLQHTKFPEDLIVYKSKLNAKHWLQYGKATRLIPCTQKDMDDILHNNINDRLLASIKTL